MRVRANEVSHLRERRDIGDERVEHDRARGDELLDAVPGPRRAREARGDHQLLEADEVDVDADGLAGQADLDVVAALADRAQARVDAALVARGIGHDVEAHAGDGALEVGGEDRGQAQRRGDVEALLVAGCAADGDLRTLGSSTCAVRMPMAPGPTTRAVSPGEATAGSHRHWATQLSGS